MALLCKGNRWLLEDDAEEEAQRGRWKQEVFIYLFSFSLCVFNERDDYWKMMQWYIDSYVTLMVTHITVQIKFAIMFKLKFQINIY